MPQDIILPGCCKAFSLAESLWSDGFFVGFFSCHSSRIINTPLESWKSCNKTMKRTWTAQISLKNIEPWKIVQAQTLGYYLLYGLGELLRQVFVGVYEVCVEGKIWKWATSILHRAPKIKFLGLPLRRCQLWSWSDKQLWPFIVCFISSGFGGGWGKKRSETRQESSMNHLASPQSRPAVIVTGFWSFVPDVRTDGQHVWK